MKQKLIFIGRVIFLVIWVGVVGWIFLSHFFAHTTQGIDKSQTVKCASSKSAKTLTISMKGFSPQKTTLHVCDILTFQNTDTKYHQPAFGDHPKHLIYPGYPDEPLKPGTSRSVVLTVAGKFPIHDHIYDELEGEIDVLQ